MVDSFLAGFWVPLMSFNWMPSFLLIIMVSMSNISVGGTNQFIKGGIGHLAGGILSVIFFGFNVHMESTMLNVYMCLPTLVVYPIMVGMVAYRLALQLNKKRKELQASLDEVKVLSGLLPICAACKKIRDDTGYWNQIETYIRDHSEADFSHSLCPGCVKKLYPDLKTADKST